MEFMETILSIIMLKLLIINLFHLNSLVFLIIAQISFPATDSLIGILSNRYGWYLVKGVRILEKSSFTH